MVKLLIEDLDLGQNRFVKILKKICVSKNKDDF